MTRFLMALAAFGAAALGLTVASGSGTPGASWTVSVPFTNVVASSPTTGGGYPVPPGSRVPEAGTCRAGPFNANHSESWLAVKPGTEDLVGTSKFFFDKYSTFYMFYLGAYQILGGTPSGEQPGSGLRLHLDRHAGDAAELDGHDRPQRRLRHQGPRLPDDAAVQLVLRRDEAASGRRDRRLLQRRPGPPLGEGQRRQGRSSRPTTPRRSSSGMSRTSSGSPSTTSSATGSRTTCTRPGRSSTATAAASRCGWRFPVTAARPSARRSRSRPPSQVGPAATYVYPEIDAAGNVYVSVVSFPPNGNERRRSTSPARPTTRRTFGAVRAGHDRDRSRRARCSEHPLPRRHRRELRRQPDLSQPSLPHLRGLGRDRRPGGREVHAVDRRRRHLDDARRRQRQRRHAGRAHRSVPAVGRRRARRRGRGRVLRPTRGLPERPERPARRRRARRTSASTRRCRRTRTAAAAPCRSAGTCGSRSSPGIRSSRDSTSAASRSTRAPEPRDPCPNGQRLHRRLLRARDLRAQHLRARWSRPTTPRT